MKGTGKVSARKCRFDLVRGMKNNMVMGGIKSVSLAIGLWLAFRPAVSVAEYYRWVDGSGTVHFSDNVGGVPDAFRERVEAGGEAAEQTGEKSSAGGGEQDAGGDVTEPGEGPRRFEVGYIPLGGAGEQRVIIPVTLNGSTTARLAIDTGAPGLVIFKALAERLGVLEGEQGKIPIMAGGIGGSTPALRTIIDNVRVGGASDEFVPATVILSSLSQAFEGLVGMDFMSRYAMEIDPGRRKVYFEELPEISRSPGGHSEQWWRRNFREFDRQRRQWRTYLDALNRFSAGFDGPEADKAKILEMKDAAHGWYREASRMYDRLTWYATDHNVPLDWRER